MHFFPIILMVTAALALACQGNTDISATSDNSAEYEGPVANDPQGNPSYRTDTRVDGVLECQFTTAAETSKTMTMPAFREGSGGVFVKLGKELNLWPNHFVRFSAQNRSQPRETSIAPD